MSEQDIRLVSTGRVLARERVKVSAAGLLAIGGVDFERAGSSQSAESSLLTSSGFRSSKVTRASGLEPFVSLPASRLEVRELAKLFNKYSGEPVSVLTGGAALEGALKSAGARRVLHIASHGFFRASNSLATTHYMTRSGLALAGANQGLKGFTLPDGEDGVLWALEAMSLQLAGTELVTLSACDTGKGVIDAGEGVYGLGRAFQIAGAKNVLLSLWPLADEEARRFMKEFYEAWLSGAHHDPAGALRATKLAWASSADPFRSDPIFWAPFILIQNGR